MVTVGSYRRLIALPAALARHSIAGARIEDGALRVRFRADGEAATVTGADEPVGSVTEEAVKLLHALQDWAKDSGSEYAGAAASAAEGAASAAHRINEHVATGGAACTYCPLCRVISAVRDTSPEVKAHLSTAMTSLMQAAAGMMATPVPEPGARRPDSAVEKIDLSDERRVGGRLMGLTVGIDVGGTKIAGGVVDEQGHILATARRESPATDTDAIEHAIEELVAELRSDHEVVAVGVGAAGFVDSKRSTVLFAPNLAWRDEPLRADLEKRIDLPVVIENDANAAAWGEFTFGAGEDVQDTLLVTVGTGVGGGIVLNGSLHRGAFGVAAEIGHMRVVPDGRICGCGNRGCWEQYASGTALVRDTKEQARAGLAHRPGPARPGRGSRRRHQRAADHRGGARGRLVRPRAARLARQVAGRGDRQPDRGPRPGRGRDRRWGLRGRRPAAGPGPGALQGQPHRPALPPRARGAGRAAGQQGGDDRRGRPGPTALTVSAPDRPRGAWAV